MADMWHPDLLEIVEVPDLHIEVARDHIAVLGRLDDIDILHDAEVGTVE